MSAGVRSVTTQALHFVRQESDQRSLSSRGREPLYRVALNIKQLISILKYGHIQDEAEIDDQRPVKSGKKRSAPDVASPRKRAKAKAGFLPAPSRQATPEADEHTKKVHVYSHHFELGYTRDADHGWTSTNHTYADDQRASEVGWLREEKELIDVISQKSEYATSSRSFDLGHVTLGEHRGVVQIFHGVRPGSVDDNLYYLRHLLTLPTVHFSDESAATGSVLYTCWELLCSRRVAMTALASLVYTPDKTAPQLPFQINITVDVSLLLPAILSPRTLQAAPAYSLEDKRRRLLSYLFCAGIVSTNGNSIDQENAEATSIRHFYSILEPARPTSSLVVDAALQPSGLHAVLLPFQRRSVKWLLEREGYTVNISGQVVPNVEGTESLPLFWQKVNIPIPTTNTKEGCDESMRWYFNRLTGSLSEEMPTFEHVTGAMLCEEMGLGKTLECIALILLNPTTSRVPTTTQWDEQTELEVSQVKTNLIVTPSTLSQQWIDEIVRHAPGLKTLLYTGYNKIKLPKALQDGAIVGQSKSHRIWCSYIQGFDIIVTTYNVLQAELGVARAPVARPKREAAFSKYSNMEKPRSPLVRVEWARVFMDEVQLVGGGKTAEMVSLIPRAVSVAVSGTPAKSKVSDLAHVLRFLRVEEAIGSTRMWERLLKPEFKDLFTDLFRTYAIRTSKAKVKDELTIPSQGRFVVGIELGKVEKHIYDQTLQEALDDLGVDARGVAASEGWELDISSLRGWLRRLRQICTHPQVGALQARGSKATAKTLGNNSIKTIPQFLQGLRDTNWQKLITDRKSKIQLRLRRAQLMQRVDEDLNRYQHTRDLLLSVQAEIEQLVEDIKVAIAEHEERGKVIKEEAAARRRQRGQPLDPDYKGKGKAREVDYLSDDSLEDSDLPHTQVGEEHRARQRTLQGRLREVHVFQHKVAFLLGDVFHVLGWKDEDAAYATAELVRRTLLKSTEEAATSAMAKLTPNDPSGGVSKKDLKLDHCQKGGIRSTPLLEEANDTLDLLNEQADLLWKWRSSIFTLLTQKLSASDGEQADGEEYARALDAQSAGETYLQGYAALLADRKEVLVAERTTLATHEARERKLRDTRAARNAENATDFDDESVDLEIQPEHEVLLEELTDERKQLRADHETRALKAITFQISQLAGDRAEETQICKEEGRRLRTIISDQGTAMEKLELELASFRKTFNERILYFRQLQELSDSVAEVEWEGDVRDAIESAKAEEDKLIIEVNSKRAKQRHLDNMAQDEADGTLDQEEDCILCRCAFQRGLMTQCAHLFCEPCLTEWLKRRGAKNHADCPVCRSNIDTRTLQRISLTDEAFEKQLQKKGDMVVKPPVGPGSTIQFNSLSQQILDEISTFEVYGSYSSKISHLVRHLLYLQARESGTKSVIFSAWSDSLTIIERALSDNGITSVRVDQKGKQNAAQRFKADPEILVFLLHGERENAGLNLTCAKRVWLLEPTVNHGFEIQAISRVDRMGQTAATEVFCYYIQDTVEENILRMGARRGLSLYTKDHSKDTIDISEFAMGTLKTKVDSPSKKEKYKGDFVEKADDLIHVLFPHLDYREADFTDSTDAPQDDMMDVDFGGSVGGPSGTGFGYVNAVAGPSRLR